VDWFSIYVQDRGQTRYVHVIGELDSATVPEANRLLGAIERAPVTSVVLDLAKLRFLDAAGVRWLVSVHQRCTNSGREVVLVRATETVQRLFTLTGTADMFTVRHRSSHRHDRSHCQSPLVG
jgi:anti-sigma B factor antagonist